MKNSSALVEIFGFLLLAALMVWIQWADENSALISYEASAMNRGSATAEVLSSEIDCVRDLLLLKFLHGVAVVGDDVYHARVQCQAAIEAVSKGEK